MNAVLSQKDQKVISSYPKGILTPSLQALNLDFVKEKLVERALYGRESTAPPVPLELLDAALEDYKRYLFLNLQYPGFPIAPSYNIDEVWHQHILFTKKYAEDCQEIFGAMRHHVPHFGRRVRSVEQDARILENTRALWTQEFGSVPKSYDGMTELTSDNGWSGNVDLTNDFVQWTQ